MSPVRSIRAGLALCAALLTGCFFQGEINEPPVAVILVENEAPLRVGGTANVTARESSDPDGEGLRFEWSARKCDGGTCDSTRFASSNQVRWSIPLPNKEPIEIRLVVTDSFGAQAEAMVRLVAENRDPELRIDVDGVRSPTGELTVGRALTFTATVGDPDGDPVALDWWLIPPKLSSPDDVTFEPLPASEDGEPRYRLVTDIDGTWTVEVEADDGDGGVATATRLISVVPDAPPCLALTAPAAVGDAPYVLLTDAGPRAFSVLRVTDELDPFPEPLAPEANDVGVAGFRWQVAAPGRDFETVVEGGAATLSIDPANYAPGDIVDVRVEVADRVDRQLPCSADQATCSILGDPACVQRLTWKVQIR